MAITQLLGLPGHGKSYEATNFIALKHFAQGRRVVTNVRGLDKPEFVQAWTDRAVAEYGSTNPGTILFVTPQQVRANDFFPDPEDDVLPSVVKAGDIVLLDEVGAIWPNRKSVTDRVLRFLTQHRHFDDPDTGWTIEVLLIMQIGILVPTLVRQLCQTTISCRKHLAFGGLGKNRYVTNVFLGSEVKGKSMATVQRRIDVKAKPLYSTTREGMAKEVNLDDRHSRKTLRVIAFMIVAVVIVPVMSWVLLRQFHSMSVAPGSRPAARAASSGVAAQAGPIALSSVVPVRSRPAGPMPSVRWRISGFVRSTLRAAVVLQDSSGNVRLVPADNFRFVGGQPVAGVVDGELVTDATGLGGSPASGADRLLGG